MQKTTRRIIKENDLFGQVLVIQKIQKGLGKRSTTSYAIFTDKENLFVAEGKELKGYLNSILWIAYDGETHGTGNYYLKSDDHGIVCKWRKEQNEMEMEVGDRVTVKGKYSLYGVGTIREFFRNKVIIDFYTGEAWISIKNLEIVKED